MNESYGIKKSNFDMKELSYEESQKMIFNYLKNLKIENPNYYKINIFIKV
jgi:hypothetical protein